MPNRYGTRRALGGLAPLNPGSLPSLELRFLGTTIAGAADSAVASWTDSSGNGRDAAQANATQKPYVSGINANSPNAPNGVNGVGFNYGENDNMTGSLPVTPISSANGYTFYLWHFESPFGITNQAVWAANASNPTLSYSTNNSKIGFVDHSGVQETGTLETTGYHSLVYVFTPPNVTGLCTIYQDGIQIGSLPWNFLTDAAAGYTLGNNVILTNPYAGIQYEFDFFSVAHDVTTVRRVLVYGKKFWGI